MVSGSFHIVVGISLAFSGILIPQLAQSDISVTKSESSWIGREIF